MEACEAWVAKKGFTLSDDRFLDQGRSGYLGEHLGEKGQLRRFLDLVEAGKIPKGSYLVIESLDRLSRQRVNEALSLFLGILGAGVHICTLMDGEKVYSPDASSMDVIMSVLVMARANEESATKSKRAKDDWESKFAKARSAERKPVGRQVAKWLKLVEGEYVPDPDRAAIVERVFRECINGHGFVSIAQRLNADNVPAFRGGTWCPSSIDDLLKNRNVLGEWEPKDGKGVIENYFPRVIDDATWKKAELAMVARRGRKVTKQTANFQVWQQVLFCALCGSTMNLVTKQKGAAVRGEPVYKYKYYVCANKRKGLCTKAVSVRMEASEEVYKRLLVAVGALGLIQTEAAEITDQMALVDASIHAEETTRARHMKRLAEHAEEDHLYELVAIANKNLKRLKAEREELEAKHTAQTIAQSDRDWLLANIPLKERDDRQRANALLCRLNIKVHIKGGDEPVYTATRPTQVRTVVLPIPEGQEPEFMTRTVERPFLQFIVKGDDIIPVPRSADQRETLKEQDSDGSETAKGMAWLSEVLGPKAIVQD